MQIAPRYDAPPLIELDGPDDEPAAPLLRQRRRLVSLLASFDEEQWRSQSRCEEWTALDVVNHLVVADGFWSASIAAALAGEPTRVLAGFDPTASPAALADAMRAQSPDESLDQLAAASGELCAAVERLDEDGWRAIGEAPPGHVPVRLLVHHALWDGWVHERDILLPAGVAPTVEDDEVLAALRYAAALGPALALQVEPGRRGVLALEPADAGPVVVHVDGVVRVRNGAAPDGAVVLRGASVELLEAISVREPMTTSVPTDQRWLVAGLADVFEVGEP